MSAQGLEAACITRPVSIAYLLGFHANPEERLMALAVRQERAVLVVPGLERQRAEAAAAEAEVLAWADGEDPYRLLAGALGSCERLGVEKGALSLAAWEAVRDATGAREPVDVGAAVLGMRSVKSGAELELLARAALLTDAVTGEVFSSLRPGQTELEVASLIQQLVYAAGAGLAFESIVQFGPNSALPHGRPSSRALQAGDLVLLDLGAAWGGYRGDITRVGVAGEASAEQRAVYDAVLEGHDRALEAVKAGVTAGEVDAAARKAIEAAGFGDRFVHRVGHGLGLEAHEAPSLDPGSDLVLEEGMVVTIEPGVYLPGLGGVRIEDDVVVEAGGARLLTNASRELRQLATA
jgi:Xaa-Pro dipeptidase